MNPSLIPLAAACLSSLFSAGALAHTDEYLATQKAPNGGEVRVAGPYHIELVVVRDSKEAKEKAVVVHVTDHAGTKVSTAGAGGTATILAGKKKAAVKLVPDGDNRLKGSAVYASTPGMKVVVAVTLAGKPTEQVRFTPLAAPRAAANDGHTDHKH